MARSKARWAVGTVGLAALGAALWSLRDLSAAIGAKPARTHDSPQFRDGKFRNAATTRATPDRASGQNAVREMLFGDREVRHPGGTIPLVRPGAAAADGLHVTWYGHSSALVEIEGRRVLVDPVWSDRVSPVSFAGPRRMHPLPVPLDELPALDAVLISHDHYDHLDWPTVRALVSHGEAPFLVPVGVGAHLRRWRVPESRIIELDWEQTAEVAGLLLTATSAQHFSGRALRRDGTLWSSWVIAGRDHKAFYTGDSGYFDGYAAIGERHGPFDVTLVQIGAYDPAWPDIHMTPEEGVAAHLDLRGGLLVPVHWGTFVLALHPWTDPADRVWREAKARDVALAVPRPGERIDVADPPSVDGWWQTLG
jgi:L-ascorbate metabolism protein UlaG (beta-lactamase superfamily)